eukprot:g19941.t1
MKRIEFDLKRAHPFACAPVLPPVNEVDDKSIAAARRELKKCVALTKSRSDELYSTVDPAINKPRACQKLGLWEELAKRFCPSDATSWEVWQSGLDCVGECKAPDAWEDKAGADKWSYKSVEEFESSRVIKDIMKGVHVKPVWSEKLIRRTWDDSAVQPARGEEVIFNEESEHVQKKRKVEQGEKFKLEIVVIDVARCYKNIFVKPAHHKYNRLVVWNPVLKKCQWFQALTAIFGSRHSVTGWCRNGKTEENSGPRKQ